MSRILPFIFKINPLQALSLPSAESLTLNDYYSMFGVDEALILKIMGIALSKGGFRDGGGRNIRTPDGLPSGRRMKGSG